MDSKAAAPQQAEMKRDIPTPPMIVTVGLPVAAGGAGFFCGCDVALTASLCCSVPASAKIKAGEIGAGIVGAVGTGVSASANCCPEKLEKVADKIGGVLDSCAVCCRCC